MARMWAWLGAAVTVWAWSASAWAQDSVGALAQKGAEDLLQTTGLISVVFYIVGAVLVGVGLLKIKRHSDQPQQVTLGSGLMWILIGVALIVAPFIISAVANTFGTTGTGPAIAPPKLSTTPPSSG